MVYLCNEILFHNIRNGTIWESLENIMPSERSQLNINIHTYIHTYYDSILWNVQYKPIYGADSRLVVVKDNQ